jgi:hypothetical protein
MTISMYKLSVPIFVQFLTAQAECIDKAVAHIEAKQLEPSFLFNMRLFPDMYPYSRQVQQAGTHAIRCCSALSGTEMPYKSYTEVNFSELKDRLASTINYCTTFRAEQINGTEELGADERKFTGLELLQTFSLRGPPKTTTIPALIVKDANGFAVAYITSTLRMRRL